MVVKTVAAGDGKEALEATTILVSVGRKPYDKGLELGNIEVEGDNRGRIVINDGFNTSIHESRTRKR